MRVSRVSSLRGDGVGGGRVTRGRSDSRRVSTAATRPVTFLELSPARQTARPDSAPSFGLCAITDQTRAPRVFEGCLRVKGKASKKRGGRAQGAWLQRVGATLRLIPSFF